MDSGPARPTSCIRSCPVPQRWRGAAEALTFGRRHFVNFGLVDETSSELCLALMTASSYCIHSARGQPSFRPHVWHVHTELSYNPVAETSPAPVFSHAQKSFSGALMHESRHAVRLVSCSRAQACLHLQSTRERDARADFLFPPSSSCFRHRHCVYRVGIACIDSHGTCMWQLHKEARERCAPSHDVDAEDHGPGTVVMLDFVITSVCRCRAEPPANIEVTSDGNGGRYAINLGRVPLARMGQV